jgi:LuxR family transcriptional regulator, maltose regulon positive regulatory protein
VDPSILSTKLYIPKPHLNLIYRNRLMSELGKGINGKLTLISAPAGFGKSTLLSSWIVASKKQVAWLSLDEDDNNITRFLTYFIAAINETIPSSSKIGKVSIKLLKSTQPPPVSVLMTALINDLSTLSEDIIIVLDDYHLITSPKIDEGLTFLLTHQPSNLHLIIATRLDPQLPTAKLRAKGYLTELRAADLRFTSSEATEFLNKKMGLELTSENLNALEDRTEGWIAGLQLAALSLQGKENPSEMIKAFSGSHRFVLDYLIEEVLDQQPKEIQDFLHTTSILDRMNGPLCNLLTGKGNSQEILETMEHTNLFIIHLDNERNWYRYHHLFRDLLIQRFRQTNSDHIPVLSEKASDWCEMNGFNEEAIDYALLSGDFSRAANLVEAQVESAWTSGNDIRVQKWIRELPADVIESSSQISIFHAWIYFTLGKFEDADLILKSTERRFIINGKNNPSTGKKNSDTLSDEEKKYLLGKSDRHF